MSIQGGAGGENGKTPPRSAGFEEFWAAYPNKAGKRKARLAWESLAKERPPLGAVLAAIERCKRSEGWREAIATRQLKFIPLPTTWLNRGGWDDYPEEPSSRPRTPPTDPRLIQAREAARERILASQLPDPEKCRITDLLDAAPSLAAVEQLEGEAGGARA